MEFFDKLSSGAEETLIKRAVDLDKLLYCVKSDMTMDGRYLDSYITFDKEKLYILSGYETTVGKKHYKTTNFTFDDFCEYPLNNFTELYVDRYRYTARLMAKRENDSDFVVARFSVGFAEKFEQFCKRFTATVKNEEIDDTALIEDNPFCPKCGNRYPDPNRKFCPNCVKKSSIILRLCGMFKFFKAQMITVFVLIIFSVALGLVAPYFGTALLYDEVLNEAGQFYGQILFVVLMMAGFKLLSTFFSSIYGVVFSRVSSKVLYKLRIDIFSSMQKLSLSFFSSKQTSSLMSRVDRDSFEIYCFFADLVPRCFANIFQLIGLVVLMLSINWQIALCMFGTIALVISLEFLWARGQRRFWRARDLARRGVNAVLTDALNGHRVVKAFAREEQEIKRFGKKNGGLFTAEFNRDNRSANFEPVQRGIYSVANAAIYIFGAYLVLKGQLAFGGLTLLISYFGVAWDPMFFFVYFGNDLTRCLDASSRMFEILDSHPTVKPPKNPHKFPNGELKGDIKIRDVSFEYEAGRPIIKNFNVNIKAGQFFGIVGKTGAGKSTIINLISRLYDVTNGEITIDGVPIKDIAFEDLRKNIGIVSQETYLFMGSIADNIRYARPDATIEEVIEAAKNANAHDFILKLQDGYDTQIGSGGVQLSGGEKQRISIARALIQRPNILIMDEATAAMDTKTERKIQSAIDNLKAGRTIIAIAHRLSTLRDADMLCVIDNGELKELGTHDELIRQKGKYFDLYKLQSESLKSIGVD